MLIQVISIFPEMFNSISNFGITGKAKANGKWDINIINPRDYADNELGYIDDAPFGGGSGMVMMAGPICDSIRAAQDMYNNYNNLDVPIIYLSAQGEVLDYKLSLELSTKKGMILICGRYEGIDERVLKLNKVKEVCIGNYILSGGELPAMVLMDCVIRLLPDVISNNNSVKNDTFARGFFGRIQYTRPYEYCGLKVPDILMSGDHKKIKEYRLKESLKKTYKVRPDLLDDCKLNVEEISLLEDIKASNKFK